MDNSTGTNSYETYPTGPNAIIMPIFAVLAIFITYVPLKFLIRVRKISACTMIITLGIRNLYVFINAILWPNDNIASWYNGAVLCDIQVETQFPLGTLLATSTAYLTKDLAQAMDTDNPRLHESRAMRRRRVAVELLFCFAIPILQMALHYIPQANRYGIVTVYGCADIWDPSWPALVIFYMWPLLFALLNCYYAILVIHRLRKHRGVLSKTLSSTGSGLNARRFLKLCFMASSFLVVYFPVNAYIFYLNLPSPFIPYSWSRVHAPESWDPIIYYTTASQPTLQYFNWCGIAMAFLAFFFYGMSNDAIDLYKGWAVKLGFSKCFPSLARPREVEARRGSASRGSWSSHFDLVSKAIHYFDTARKGSQATNEDATRSRKASSADKFSPSIYLSNIKSISSVSPDSAAHPSFAGDITPVPSPARVPFTHKIDSTIVGQQEPISQGQGGSKFFNSTFRTHLNSPFPLFSFSLPSSRKPTTATSSLTSILDLESRGQSFAEEKKTVQTTIWSPSSTAEESDIDPFSPKMGTRAYRERERREMLEAKKDNMKDGGRKVIADEVNVDGVKVEKKVVRREDDIDSFECEE